MPLPVFTTERAQQDVDESYQWWAENRSFEQARRWRDKCVAVIDSLPEKWTTTALASEGALWPFEVRQLNFGLGRRPSHRVVFTVRPDMIFVLRLRHLSQRPLLFDDL